MTIYNEVLAVVFYYACNMGFSVTSYSASQSGNLQRYRHYIDMYFKTPYFSVILLGCYFIRCSSPYEFWVAYKYFDLLNFVGLLLVVEDIIVVKSANTRICVSSQQGRNFPKNIGGAKL